MNSVFHRFDEPSKKEKGNSHYLSELQKSFKEYSDENEKKQKMSLFLQFMVVLDNFIILEKNKDLVKKYVPHYFKEVLSFSQIVSGDAPILIQMFNLLDKIIGVIPGVVIKPKFICSLLEDSCIIQEMYPKILELSKPCFHKILSDEKIFKHFATSGSIELMFEKIFVYLQNERVGKFFNSLLFENMNRNIYQYVDFNEIAEFVCQIIESNKIVPKMAKSVALFVANLFKITSWNGKSVTKFLKSKSFVILSNFIKTIPVDDRLTCYVPLIMSNNEDGSSPPNISIYKRIGKIFEETPEMQKQIFYQICSTIQNSAENIDKMDKAVPMENWFIWEEPVVNDLMLLLITLDSISPNMVKRCLKILFKCFKTDKTITYDNLFMLSSIILNQISKKFINYSDLLEFNFLDEVIIILPEDYIRTLLIESEDFKDVIFKVYSLDEAKPKHPKIFKYFISVCTDSLIDFATKLFAVNPCETCIVSLLYFIKKEKRFESLKIIIDAFSMNALTAEKFVKTDGLQWAFAELSIDDLTNLLANFVRNRRFEELDEIIYKLPADHPLFSQPEDVLEKIIFGMNNSEFRPIRVRSLVHLLKKPFFLDPYNSWILGSSYIDICLQKTNDIFQVPMIDQIANRRFDSKFLDMVLERPYDIEKFCDPSKDHFQMFQIYPGNEELTLTMNCMSVSFWFRFNDSEEQTPCIFKTDYINISLINKRLTFISGHTKKDLVIDPSKWHFVGIRLDKSMLGSSLMLYVDDIVYTFQLTEKITEITEVSFGAGSRSLMFLGSAIRIMINKSMEFSNLYKKGPSCITKVNYDDTVITPDSVKKYRNIRMPPSYIIVPYYGLPVHLISLAHVRLLINAMENAETQEKFESVFNTLINIQEITKIHNQIFFQIISTSLIKCAKFVTKEVFTRFVTSQIDFIKESEILTSIVYNRKIWSSIDNSIIVSVLLENFQKSDFKAINGFEFFLFSKILSSVFSFSLILKNIKKLDIIAKYLPAGIRIGSIEVQRNILMDLTNFTEKKTVDIVTKIVPFSFLVDFSSFCDFTLKPIIIHLIALIQQNNQRYVEVKDSFLNLFIECAKEENVWNDAILIVENSNKAELNSIPIVLAAFSDKKEVFDYLHKNISTVLGNSFCRKVIQLMIYLTEKNFTNFEIKCESVTKDFFSSQSTICPSYSKVSKEFEYTSKVFDFNSSDFFNIVSKNDSKAKERCESMKNFLRDAKIEVSNENQKYLQEFFKNVYSAKYREETAQEATKRLIRVSFDSLKGEFLLREEVCNWSSLKSSFRNQSKEINNFNHYSYFLTTKCFPLSYPRVLLPSGVFSEGEGYQIFSKEKIFCDEYFSDSLLDLYIKIHGNGEKSSFKFSAKLVRFREVINCVVFIFQESIDILTFCSLSSNKNCLELQEVKQMHFFDDVVNGEWGDTDIFAGRIIVRLPFNDIISISNSFDEGKSYCIWSFTSGCFELRIPEGKLTITSKLEKICEYSKSRLPPIRELLSINTVEEAMEKYENRILSCHDVILYLNSLSNHFFVDPYNSIIFPSVDSNKFPSFKELAELEDKERFNILFQLEKIDTPKTILKFAEEKLGINTSNIETRGKRSVLVPMQHAGLVNSVHVFSKLSLNPKGSLIYDFDEITEIPALTFPIECSHNFAISIDKENMSLMIINSKTKSVIYKLVSQQFVYATNLTVAKNGLFIVVDYSLCFSRTFRIIYSEGIPRYIQSCSELCFDTCPHTVVSGSDCVCFTIFEGNKNIVVWNSFNSRIIRNIELDDIVTCIAIDEELGFIWCCTKKKGLHLITINGEEIYVKEMPNSCKVTTIKSIPLPSHQFLRSCLIGMEDGRIYCAEYLPQSKLIAIKPLPSPHTTAIRVFVLHCNLTSFISIDEECNSAVFYLVGVRAPTIRKEDYAMCAICNSEPTEYCKICNRMLCKKCCESGTCLYCQAVFNYL